MSQRPNKVAEAIKRAVSDLMLHGIKDERVHAGMASVTRVEVTGDLRHARIYVSIFGSTEEQEEAMAGLNSALGYIRSEVGKRVPLRFTPELRLVHDLSIAKGSEVLELMDRIAREDAARANG